MKYLIVQDWSSTHGNHAGMHHMCKLLVELYPEKYRIVMMEIPESCPVSGNLLMKVFNHIYFKYYQPFKHYRRYLDLCSPTFKMLKENDEVYLLEYLLQSASQYGLAVYIRKHFPNIKIYALSHLTTSFYKSFPNSKSFILKWEKPVDKMLTLGSSLSDFFFQMGVNKSKISTGFHYVDLQYYNVHSINQNKCLTIIAIGNLQRDFLLLAAVIRNTPGVSWIVCKGRMNVDSYFKNCKNVVLKDYVEEDELRSLMSQSDISINVMEDTVGSNVITTSMAMGLGIIVSDVGSIHDYCTNENAVFCQNTAESFTDAVVKLRNDYRRVLNMREASLNMAKKLNVNNIDKWFSSL